MYQTLDGSEMRYMTMVLWNVIGTPPPSIRYIINLSINAGIECNGEKTIRECRYNDR